MRRIAASSVGPQLQKPEPNTSPVRHSLWTRTSGASARGDVAAHERHVTAVVEHRLEGDELEVAPRRRQRRLADAAHQLLGPPAVADEVGDRDQQQAVVGAELLQLRAPGHVVLALADDLAQHADRRAAGHPGEVDGGLGVTRPA